MKKMDISFILSFSKQALFIQVRRTLLSINFPVKFLHLDSQEWPLPPAPGPALGSLLGPILFGVYHIYPHIHLHPEMYVISIWFDLHKPIIFFTSLQ